ncbi:hypothetical protein N5C55_02795 [Pseudomonas otitidis]|uniref:hypothetical protein n=1 Tax=Metapseudomonas otitidis TaxID=319939 RepID=UPI002448EFF2|nr:hypothetical protein [Pseudomonas otitidis]MDH1104805.1 hypothetical protein [Pseudomonas otitidis]MDH1157092.1 hypothetical protein [Pseudomonas otitidis]MDH1164716.1 hypothetical protein [Pseudomonas otitidis]
MSGRKQVTIQYRKFVRPEGVRFTLEEMIRSAMDYPIDGGIQLKHRYLERLHEEGTDNYFINLYQDSSEQLGFVFGDILHFSRGHLQALARTADQNAQSVPVQQLRAPEQSEYVHSQMFWMIKDDHAFVIQSMSLKSAELESYLSWLLKTKSSVLGSENSVTLTSKFDMDEVGGELADIQQIIIGGVATPPPRTPPQPQDPAQTVERVSEETQHRQIDTSRTTGWGTARRILAELLGGEANVTSLMQSVPADAELDVQVHIGFKTKKRKIDRVALNQLETGLRNVPDSQLQVKAKGRKIDADGSIRLHHKASVKLIVAMDGNNEIIGNLLDPADVLRATIEAYSNLVANGKISE